MPTLYDDINEAEKQLNLKQKETDDGEDNGASVQQDGSVSGRSGQEQGEHSGEGALQELGGAGERGDPEGTPRGKSGAPHGDGGAPQKDNGTPQKDGGAPQEDGETLLKEPTNSDWARLRREQRELKAELARLKAEKTAPAPEIKKEEPKPEIKAEPVKEPNKEENYQAWLEWKLQQQDNTIQEQAKLTREYKDWRTRQEQSQQEERITNAAVEEFTRIEDAYKKENPDYGNAIEFARQKYLDAAKIFYPEKTEKQIEEAIDKQMLTYAAQYASKGLNPAEELYDLVQEKFGYKKAEVTAAAEEEKPAPKQKPNLRIVNENRKRSATPLGTGGQSGSISITKEIAADMSVGEFSRLTPEDLANLEAQG